MKKVLITGKNSYVGRNVVRLLSNFPGEYLIDSISLRDDSWKRENFSHFDTVIHVAGIAHLKESKVSKKLYYNVNCKLAYEVAQKAKFEGVRQFIFLSSMSVYGLEEGVINENTPLNPRSNYGRSKLKAEELIAKLDDPAFRIAILRPPMIYGKGCKGNYPKLSRLAFKTPIFPDINNYRSMIFIDNLSMFIKWLIDNFEKGLYFPQNKEYVKTSKMVELISKTHGKRIWLTSVFNPFLKLMKNNNTINKIFGNLVYDKSLSNQLDSFIDFEESIRFTEED